jgi:glycosyltransferase involved in cell wall biosynthesis
VNYILITPVKNEEANLPLLAECVANQTSLPKVWVIVDGNSKDNTLKIIKELKEKFEWVYWKIQENFSPNSGHLNFAYAVREGYEYANEICVNKQWNYEYVGKVDADVLLPKNYFEKLTEKFKEYPKLGVASGFPYTLKTSSQIRDYEYINEIDADRDDFLPDELPDKRLFKKNCLDDIGGFPLSKYAPDSVMLAKARLVGWETRWFDDLKIYNLRKDTGTERQVWESFKQAGHVKYYLDYHPLLFSLSVLNELRKKPYYYAFAFMFGYLSSFMKGEEKIEDFEIRGYFRHKRLREILDNNMIAYFNRMVL